MISLDEHGIVTMDNYDIGDFAAALARYDELVTQHDPRGGRPEGV
ncbi:MAG TPA: hypothetical protein VLA10_04220 [Ilumatobacter sp.]|nr:hypothetical protein [Ilumatobacter sp.]